MIAARKVGAPDGPGEKHVAHQREAVLGAEEDHMAGRMPGTVAHLQPHPAELDFVTTDKPARGRESAQRFEAEAHALQRQVVDEKAILCMRSFDRQSQAIGQLGGAAAVVDVSVGEKDFFQYHALPFGDLEYAFDVAARVDNRGFFRLLAYQEGAVLLEGCYGNNGDFHAGWTGGRD